MLPSRHPKRYSVAVNSTRWTRPPSPPRIEELPSAHGGPDATVAQLLVDTGLTASLGESRRAIEQGGVYVNNQKVTEDAPIGDRVLAGGIAVLRRGKKTLAGVRVS